VLDQSLTIVLSVHNGERQIRSSALDILELSHSIATNIELVIVDNGSTDDTYEAACELARSYPQIRVFRQRMQLSLDAAMQLVRSRISVDMMPDMMIGHDGKSPIEVEQLRRLLSEDVLSDNVQRGNAARSGTDLQPAISDRNDRAQRDTNRFASVRAVQQGLEQVHRSLLGFRWIQIEAPIVPRRRSGGPLVGLPNLVSTPIPGTPPASL
jgi:hypothetical protein